MRRTGWSRRRWLLAGSVLLLPALIVVLAWLAGLRVQGAGWQQGPTLALWQWRKGDCLALQGEGLSVSAWRPLRIHLDSLRVRSCPPSGELAPPPWTPPFALQVDRLQVEQWPVLALDVSQQDQHWRIRGSHGTSQIQADYQRGDGAWRIAGELRLPEFSPSLRGRAILAAAGVWLPGRLQGQVALDGHALGRDGLTQQADARVQARLSDGVWTLDADLTAPLSLPAGWQLQARKSLSLRGDADGLQALQADLLAQGPQGRVQLLLDSAPGAQAGTGELRLSGGELDGHLPLRWTRQQLTLAAGELRLPQSVRLRLPSPVSIPLAARARVSLPLSLTHDALTLTVPEGVLSWGGNDAWSWQGRMALTGRQSGFAVSAGWRGRITPSSVSGEPVRVDLRGADAALRLEAPVTTLRAPGWPLQVDVRGRYGSYPLQGSLSLARGGDGWEGMADLSSRLAVFDQGGTVRLRLPWMLSAGAPRILPGARLDMAQGLKGSVLVRPLTLMADKPLSVTGDGLHGALTLHGQGLVAARASLPALTGDITLAGRQARAALQLPAWRSRLVLDAGLVAGGAQGRLTLDTPVHEAMSQGLGLTLRQGQVRADADWSWSGQPGLRAQGRLTGSDLALDWGGVKAEGGQGSLRFTLAAGDYEVSSLGALTLDTLDVGTPVSHVSLGLAGDAGRWRLSDVSARVLGGRISAPALQWPADDYQAVTLTGIDLAQVVALQGQDNAPVSLTGTVAGELPVLLGRSTLALRHGQVHNEGPLTLRILPSAGISAMSQSNRAVQLALDTLSHLLVSDFRASLDMAPDGWLDAAVTIRGDSVQPNRQPVVLNYTHRENVLELLRSLRMADEISQQVMDRHKAAP
ncbi:MAG: YdbH domain-containing protein [Perlucidibaca sp.]